MQNLGENDRSYIAHDLYINVMSSTTFQHTLLFLSWLFARTIFYLFAAQFLYILIISENPYGFTFQSI